MNRSLAQPKICQFRMLHTHCLPLSLCALRSIKIFCSHSLTCAVYCKKQTGNLSVSVQLPGCLSMCLSVCLPVSIFSLSFSLPCFLASLHSHQNNQPKLTFFFILKTIRLCTIYVTIKMKCLVSKIPKKILQKKEN